MFVKIILFTKNNRRLRSPTSTAITCWKHRHMQDHCIHPILQNRSKAKQLAWHAWNWINSSPKQQRRPLHFLLSLSFFWLSNEITWMGDHWPMTIKVLEVDACTVKIPWGGETGPSKIPGKRNKEGKNNSYILTLYIIYLVYKWYNII